MSADSSIRATKSSHRIGAWVAWYSLTIIILLTLFANFDHSLFSVMAEPVRISLGMSDVKLGMIYGLGFALFGAVASIPIGWLLDQWDRRAVLALAILIWSAATAACGLANNFLTMLIAVSGLAAAEAGLAPITYTIIPDLFSGRMRYVVNLLFYATRRLGGAAGLAGAGLLYLFIDKHACWLPAAFGNLETWRLTFIAGALPAPIFLVLALTLPRLKVTPVEQTTGQAWSEDARVGFVSYVRKNWVTVFGIFMAPAIYTMAFSTAIAWFPAALVRALHASAGKIGAELGTTALIGSLLGLVLSGVVTALGSRRLGRRLPLRAGRWMLPLVAIPAILIPFARSPLIIYGLIAIFWMLAIAPSALIPALYQDLAPPHLRGRLLVLSGPVIGAFMALGSILVGAISKAVGPDPHSLMWALAAFGAPCWLAAGGIYGLLEPRFLRLLADNGVSVSLQDE